MKCHQNICQENSPVSGEELAALILHNVEDLFLLVNKNLCIIGTNEATKKKAREYLGREILSSQTNILELVPPGRHSALIKIYEDVFNGKSAKTETRLITPSGDIYLENHFKPAKNEKGEIIGAFINTREITENKKAEKALKEMEERWRFALEGANQGVWDWNIKTNQVFYSNSYKKLYGYEDYELTGSIEEWQSMIHPEDRAKMEDAVKEHMTSSNPYYESTYRSRAKDGRYKWILARGMIIGRDDNGTALRMIGTHTDITDQINAEETYKLLFYSNPLPMWTYDKHSNRFLSVNNAAISHYGYSLEEFLSMSISDIWPEEDRPGLNAILKKRKELPHYRSVGRHKKKNGEIIHVEISTHDLKNPNNSILVVAHDITSKILAENELKESNERFLLVSRATSDAIYDWDINNNSLYWGEGIQTLFGFDPKEVPINLWENLIHPDDREKVKTSLSVTLDNTKKKNWNAEYRFAKANGSFSYVLDRGFIIRDEKGKAVRMIGSMQDITELKYKEQLLSLERQIFELSSNPKIEFTRIVDTLLRGIENIHDDAYTSVWLLRDQNTINSFVAPRIPDDFLHRLNKIKKEADKDECDADLSIKEPVIVEDFSSDDLCPEYKKLAMQYQFKACRSLPITNTTGKVLGIFAIYYKETKPLSSSELNTLDRVKNILRIVMEHHWFLNEIKIANERFDAVMKATHDLIWDWDLESNMIYRDEIGLKKVYGIDNNASIGSIQDWLKHIHADDLEKVQKVINNIIQSTNENTFDVEYRFKRNDGSYSYVYDRGIILRNAEGKLERMIGAAQDITDRKRLEQELLQHELEKQKAINQATVDSQEAERTEIGKELHDNVNQVLTTTKLYLELALSNTELKDDLIEKSNKNILRVINEIRQLSRSLMDPSIDDLGLIDSIHDLAENINLTGKLHVALKADKKTELFLDKSQKLTIFRIIQEALNNSIRHAKASSVLIRLKHQMAQAELIVEDNGIGFDPSSIKKGAGLKNIQNRVYLINGSYAIHSAPQKGCKLIINFPINK